MSANQANVADYSNRAGRANDLVSNQLVKWECQKRNFVARICLRAAITTTTTTTNTTASNLAQNDVLLSILSNPIKLNDNSTLLFRLHSPKQSLSRLFQHHNEGSAHDLTWPNWSQTMLPPSSRSTTRQQQIVSTWWSARWCKRVLSNLESILCAFGRICWSVFDALSLEQDYFVVVVAVWSISLLSIY